MHHPEVVRALGANAEPRKLNLRYVPHAHIMDKCFRDVMEMDGYVEHIVYVECRGLRDSDDDKSLRKHTGKNVNVMKDIMQNTGFPDVIQDFKEQFEMQNVRKRDRVALVFVSNKGTHRSEACRLLFTRAIKDAGGQILDSQPISCRDCVIQKGGCNSCKLENWTDDEHKDFLEMVGQVYGMIFPTSSSSKRKASAVGGAVAGKKHCYRAC